MVLPIIRPNIMRKTVSKDRLDAIQSQIAFVLSQPSTIDADDAQQFLSIYMNDLSMSTLDPEFYSVSKTNKPSTSDNLDSSINLQSTALGLLEHLAAKSTKSISSSLLIDAMIAYSASPFHARIQTLAKTILAATPYLSQEILTALQIATQSCFGSRMLPNDTLRSLHRATRALVLILHASPEAIVEEFTGPNSTPGTLILVQIYDHLLPSIATALSQSSRPISQSLIRGDAEWAKTWLEIKTSILDILQIAFSFVISKNPSSEHVNPLTTFASTLTSAGPPPSQIQGKRTLLVDSPLLADYERLFQLSETLRAGGWKDGGPTAIFASFAEHLQIDKDLVQMLIRSDVEQEKTPIPRTTPLPVQSDVKGKGKGRAVYEEPNPAIEDGVNTILAILPDQDPAFVRKCLHHSNYVGEGGVERLMAALLEGTVPIELSLAEEERNLEDDFEDNKREESVEEIIKGRANVFDALQMDMSSLRIGKKQDTADKLLEDSWRREMKADILRRAQEVSDEEDERRYGPAGEAGRRRLVPFDEDEFDDDFGNVSVVGDGETSDGEDEEAEEKVPVETRLELAYIESPALFGRDAAARKSAGRKALRDETGWSDQQIEDWKVMLDRNPQKDKILEKHEFRGNKAAHVSGVESRDGGDGGSRGGRGGQGRGRGRGRGGGGRGTPGGNTGGGGDEGNARGRGEGGGTRGRGGRGGGEAPTTERDRALKAKNKSRGKQRGHDRKMAGGAGPA